MWHKRARNRGVANIQISSKLFCAFTPFSKKQSKYSGSPEIVKFPINAHPGKDDLTWRKLQHAVQHVCTIVHYCTLPKWAEAQWVIESLRAKAEKSSNFRSMSVEMTWLCSKPLVLVVQEHSHWPTINYHLTLFTSSVLLFCFEHWTPSGLCQ